MKVQRHYLLAILCAILVPWSIYAQRRAAPSFDYSETNQTAEQMWGLVQQKNLYSDTQALKSLKKGGAAANMVDTLAKKSFDKWTKANIVALAYEIIRCVKGIDSKRQQIIREALNYLEYSVGWRDLAGGDATVQTASLGILRTQGDISSSEKKLYKNQENTLKDLALVKNNFLGLGGDSEKTTLIKNLLRPLVSKASAWLPAGS